MCGAPERLTAFGARTFLYSVITTIMDHKVRVQLLKMRSRTTINTVPSPDI
jgi:hypothetical protein